MRHARLLLKLVTGFLWACLVAPFAWYMVMSEEYRDAFDAWRK